MCRIRWDFFTRRCASSSGSSKFGEEYKVMGLAAYGQPVYLDLMRELIGASGNREPEQRRKAEAGGGGVGSISAERKVFPAAGEKPGGMRGCDRRNCFAAAVFGGTGAAISVRRAMRGAALTQRENDIACSVQARFEEVVLACLAALHQRVPTDKLVTAGGCALNGVCNARILRETPFQEILHPMRGVG